MSGSHLVQCGRITAYSVPYKAAVVGEETVRIPDQGLSERPNSPRVNFLAELGLAKRGESGIFDGNNFSYSNYRNTLMGYDFETISASWMALQDIIDTIVMNHPASNLEYKSIENGIIPDEVDSRSPTCMSLNSLCKGTGRI